MDNLYIIAGALRSGSTMVHLMLDNHPDIENPGEFDFLFDRVGDDGSLPEPAEFHQWLELNRIFQSQQLTIDNTLPVKELLVSFVQQARKHKSILALNIHRNFHRIPFIFPKAKYIHLIRDPRDVARSSIDMGWAGNVYYGIDHWISTEKSWQQLQRQISAEKIYNLYYENLVRNVEQELNQICHFLGLAYSKEMLNYSNNSTYSAPDIKLIEQWKTKLSATDIALVELKARNLMAGLGYQTVSSPEYAPSLFQRLSLAFHNAAYKYKFAIRRYGFLLFLKEKAGRYLKIDSLYKHALLQMNEIDKLHLK